MDLFIPMILARAYKRKKISLVVEGTIGAKVNATVSKISNRKIRYFEKLIPCGDVWENKHNH